MASALKLRLRTANLQGGGGIGIGGGVGEVIPAAYFGMHINNAPDTTIWGDYSQTATNTYKKTPWPDIGLGLLRIWDSNGCSWRNIERSRGVYSWSRFDYYADLARTYGAKVMYTLGCGPDWATTAQGQMPGLYVGYNPHPPALDADWTNWCTAVATRLVSKGHVGASYEIWNEVNDYTYGPGEVGSGYSGTTARLVQLTSLARAAIKAIDPSAVIVSPNFTGEAGILGPESSQAVTLSKFAAAGGLAFVDVVAIHGYNTVAPWTRPESLISHAKGIKDVLANAGRADLPVWNTEWGWGQWRDSTGAFHSGSSGTPAPDPMPDSKAASYMARMLLLNWLVGFRRLCHYTMDGYNWSAMPMVDPSNPAILKPPSAAYKFLSGLLVGGYLSGLTTAVSNGKPYFRATFTSSTGRFGRVYWCDDYSTASVPIPGAVQVLDQTGQTVSVTADLAVTGNPQFVFFN